MSDVAEWNDFCNKINSLFHCRIYQKLVLLFWFRSSTVTIRSYVCLYCLDAQEWDLWVSMSMRRHSLSPLEIENGASLGTNHVFDFRACLVVGIFGKRRRKVGEIACLLLIVPNFTFPFLSPCIPTIKHAPGVSWLQMPSSCLRISAEAFTC